VLATLCLALLHFLLKLLKLGFLIGREYVEDFLAGRFGIRLDLIAERPELGFLFSGHRSLVFGAAKFAHLIVDLLKGIAFRFENAADLRPLSFRKIDVVEPAEHTHRAAVPASAHAGTTAFAMTAGAAAFYLIR
jgi:hypothetical protein